MTLEVIVFAMPAPLARFISSPNGERPSASVALRSQWCERSEHILSVLERRSPWVGAKCCPVVWGELRDADAIRAGTLGA